MKNFLIITALVPMIATAQTRKQIKAQAKADKITLANIQSHISLLASDSLEGRRTGTPGEQKAAAYIAGQFLKNGLQPKGTDGYLQTFFINEGKQYKSGNNFMMINGKALKPGNEYFPLSYSGRGLIDGQASPMLREQEQPWFFDVKDALEENEHNPHFDINNILHNEALAAASKGATALIVYNTSSIVDNIQFNKNDSSAAEKIPVVYISKNAMNDFFSDATQTFDIKIGVEIAGQNRTATNVIGFLNYNAPTTVIIGAHFDHLGYGEDGNSLDGLTQIHNGADDNASGTAALIELSRIIKTSGAIKNNYLFIAFSGEELGLFGSKYWLENPTVQTTANYMLNMDMIGRYDSSKKLTIGGYGTSPVWSSVLSPVTNNDLIIKFDSSGTGPSDHASFYRKDIPVLFFFTNSHSDYHKATDDDDKINYGGEVKVINYVMQVIKNTDDKGRLEFLKTRDQEMRSVSLPVTLGVMPDYGFTGTGMRIDGVSKGKLAERIGLQTGDILLQLGDYKFTDVQTYMQALKNFKKGDKATLKIVRGKEEKVFDIQF